MLDALPAGTIGLYIGIGALVERHCLDLGNYLGSFGFLSRIDRINATKKLLTTFKRLFPGISKRNGMNRPQAHFPLPTGTGEPEHP